LSIIDSGIPKLIEGLKITIDCMEREHAQSEHNYNMRMNQLRETYRLLLKANLEVIKGVK